MAELRNADALENSVHYLDVLGALWVDAHAAAHPEAVASNPAWVDKYGEGAPRWLAKFAAELDLTEVELVTEARRQCHASLVRAPGGQAHLRKLALLAELDDWLAARDER